MRLLFCQQHQICIPIAGERMFALDAKFLQHGLNCETLPAESGSLRVGGLIGCMSKLYIPYNFQIMGLCIIAGSKPCNDPHDHNQIRCSLDTGSKKQAMLMVRLILMEIVCWIFALLAVFKIVAAETTFDPYAANGGLVSAVAGKDFCIIAADTRMSGSGYLLHSRNHLSSRLWTVNDDPIMTQFEELLRKPNLPPVVERELPISQVPILIGSSGCTADCRALQLDLRADLRAASYLGQARIDDPDQVATSLSQMLYRRRGFPYYSFCVAAGLNVDSQRGHVYVYDAIGSYEQVAVATSGTGRDALQPILDRMFETSIESPRQVEGTAKSAIHKLCLAYRSVSEREIGVGDKLVLHVAQVVGEGKVNCQVLVVPLKED